MSEQRPARRVVRLAGIILVAFALPFIALAAYAVIVPKPKVGVWRTVETSAAWTAVRTFGPMVITSLVGYLVIARAFRRHRLGVALGALLYFPFVWYCQMGFAVWLSGVLYDDWL